MTPAYEVQGKVMFSVCLSVHRGGTPWFLFPGPFLGGGGGAIPPVRPVAGGKGSQVCSLGAWRYPWTRQDRGIPLDRSVVGWSGGSAGVPLGRTGYPPDRTGGGGIPSMDRLRCGGTPLAVTQEDKLVIFVIIHRECSDPKRQWHIVDIEAQ